jgi:hypothetical protein
MQANSSSAIDRIAATALSRKRMLRLCHLVSNLMQPLFVEIYEIALNILLQPLEIFQLSYHFHLHQLEGSVQRLWRRTVGLSKRVVPARAEGLGMLEMVAILGYNDFGWFESFGLSAVGATCTG